MICRGCFLFGAAMVVGSAQWFAGAGGGISTLSADGQTNIDNAITAISLYKPENGPSAHAFAGRHLNNYFSLQGNYTWNRNTLSLTGSRLANGAEATFQQDYRGRSHTAAGEGLIYFRARASRFRPYLSGGVGLVNFNAKAGAVTVSKGAVQLPPAAFRDTLPIWRTAVGIDIRLRRGYAFRYNFWETLSDNPISRQLTPAGVRNLANFQSIFSLLKEF
jgi:hypothetical protein